MTDWVKQIKGKKKINRKWVQDKQKIKSNKNNRNNNKKHTHTLLIERTRKTESNERIQNEKSGKVVKCERININRKKRIEKSNAFVDNTNYARSTKHNKIVTEITFMFYTYFCAWTELWVRKE